MTELGPSSQRELENHLVNRALKDEEFRKVLLSDPRSAVESELARLGLDIKLAPGLRVKVLEESADTLYLILPPSLLPAPPTDDEMLAFVENLALDSSSRCLPSSHKEG